MSSVANCDVCGRTSCVTECCVCGWEFYTVPDEPDKACEQKVHLSTLQHQASMLGEAGRVFLREVAELRLRRMGVLRGGKEQ